MRKSFQLSPWPSSIDSLYQFGYGKDVQTNPRPALSQREEGKHEDCISIPITKKKELLAHIVSEFEIEPADIDETPFPDEQPVDYVRRMAEEKHELSGNKMKRRPFSDCQ